ncbi:hypothetical protein ACTHR6_23575 [Ralstonia holmesii]|jgi:hypothetical protein|uniref:Uncharacterized protein n=1 Tax=Ralstonia insidiosa TaxID=190721 RepID=A0A192A8F0_9RALS|nr:MULTISPECIES: hypothetical protein [Ralstonia]ANJ76551.1 hypothetical protein A9Y76_28635 [Ralstonia insidiosa]MBA9869581.1 hypothetical protein [Ralstonia insidiosa]MBA9885221.1 hypothetical protein [Ralstonia pickettii]MBA9895000.1 hypothetical protein [Ralstonia pickettii]MBA9913711.1 hypothetical protein [Ralstonia insidiosa]
MTLNDAFAAGLNAAVQDWRASGATDVALVGEGASHMRSPAGISPLESPTHFQMLTFAELVLGEERAKAVSKGGQDRAEWNGCSVSVFCIDEGQSLHAAIRLI